MRLIPISLFASTALLGGCVSVKPRENFPAVRHDVAGRIGYRVHWHDGSPADQAAAARVAELLARPLDVDAAVQVALLNNRRLQATYETLGVAQADLVAAGLLKNPIFDGSYRFPSGGGSATIDLGVTFDFLDLLLIGLRKRTATAELNAAKVAVTAAVLDLAGDVKAAYFAQQAADQAVELRRQVELAMAASADLAKRLRDAGNITALRLAREQAAYADAKLALTAAEADAVVTRERLNVLMGQADAPTNWTLAGRLPDPSGEEPAAADVERIAVEKSLDLTLARASIETAKTRLGLALPMGVLSEVEAGVSAERDDGDWEVGPSVTLPIPIFSQGQPVAARLAAHIRQAEAEAEAAASEVRSAARSAAARTASLRQQVDAARNTLMPLRAAVVEQTLLQYNAMQVGTFELLQAKRDQIETAASYVSLLRDYWTAKARLELIQSGRVTRDGDTSRPTLRAASAATNVDEH